MSEQATCIGKEAFTNKARAQQVLRRMAQRKGFKGTATAYPCRYCSSWHIGRPASG